MDERPTSRLPVIVVERPRCPSCNSPSIKTRSSRREGDGAMKRYCRCRACKADFIAFVE